MSDPVLSCEIPGLSLRMRGKVRDVYDLGDSLLLIASDRISAFDVIMPNGIPNKGRVLTQLSHFWFQNLAAIAEPHEITTEDSEIAALLESRGVTMTPELRTMLAGRAMVGKKAQALPIECVVRGYLSGSWWKEYKQAGGETQSVTLHGHTLPAGLLESSQLPQPIFTPATKAESGHDLNISVAEAGQMVGEQTVRRLEAISIALYVSAAERARRNGIIIADTKFEFGLCEGRLLWIDEALTPDSSRFWDETIYEPGKPQPSYDKQFVRDWLEQSGWNKEPPAPILPPEVTARTSEKYQEAYRRLTGHLLVETRD